MRPLNISASQAKDYYYDKDLFFSNENSQWHGELSQKFGLSGQCEEHHFINVIVGNDPQNGRQIICDGVNKAHRAAVDIPFAAPKSVSVMALHGGDAAIIDAHQKAVAATINYIENEYIYARKTVHRDTTAFKTGNGLFVTFMHSTSRANDPHLHTHTLVMNMTHTKDGFRATYNDPFYKDQTLIGFVYQSELAKNIRELGYGIENYSNGKWEIAGFKNEWVKRFSTRSKEIDKKLEQTPPTNAHDAKKRNQAQKSSRSQKNLSLSPEELRQTWEAKVAVERIQAAVSKYKSYALDQNRVPLNDYITLACNAIHEKESTFTRQEITTFILDLSRGDYTITEIDKAFFNSIKNGEIEHLGSQVNSKCLAADYLSSREMRVLEQNILHTFNQEKEAVPVLFESEQIKNFVDKNYNYFTAGQKEMVQNILTSTSRFGIIQGDAGTGKTSALEAIKAFIDTHKSNIKVIGLGYTGKATHEIQTTAAIPSQTIHGFLHQAPKENSAKQQLWIVDESSMVGSKQMSLLMDRAIKADAKVTFMGDGKQLQSIAAGRMFKDLQQHGHVHTVKLEEAIRQKTPYMQQAVLNVKRFQEGKDDNGIDRTLALLKNRTREIPDQADRVKTAADYLLNHDEKQTVLIVSPLNRDRLEINEIIHTRLKGDQPEINIPIRVPIHLSGTSRFFAQNYKKGQTAFVQSSNIAGLKAGKDIEITGIDTQNNRLTILDSKNKSHTVDLWKDNASLSIYEVERRSFFEGEKIVFLKNDRRLGLSNGQTGVIRKIGPQATVEVKLDGRDKTVRVNLKSYPYIDRGYAVTVHKSQGQTAKDVLLLSQSKHQLNTTETLYVALSRAQYNFSFITDNVRDISVEFKSAQPKKSTLDFVAALQKDRDKNVEMEKAR